MRKQLNQQRAAWKRQVSRAVEGTGVWKEQQNKTVLKFLNRWFWSIWGGRVLSVSSLNWLVNLVKVVNLASLYRLRLFRRHFDNLVLSAFYLSTLNIKLDFWFLSTCMYSWLSCSSIEADLSDTKFYLKIWMEMHIKNNTYLSWYIT